jgi:hypothetical protein
VEGVLGMKVFDFGLARTRVPVRRAREFIERTKAEADFMRRAVVVVDMVGDVRWGRGFRLSCSCSCWLWSCVGMDGVRWFVIYRRNDRKVEWETGSSGYVDM